MSMWHPIEADSYNKGYEDGKRDAVKHGEWIEDGCMYRCSECGNLESYYSDSYCRCCGAKMDGKEIGR